MARPETETYQVTFSRLSPGDTINVLNWQAKNPRSRIVLRWEDKKTKVVIVSLEVSPFWARYGGYGNLQLKDIYELMRSANRISVLQSPYSSIPNLSK